MIAGIMPKGMAELVGRAMIDPEFLADLQRAPESILARYDLTDDERAAIHTALVRLAQTPLAQRAQFLRTTLIRRVAT